MATKHKKRHSNSTMAAKKRANAEAIADQKDRARRRMNPVARNLLLGDVVFLAACIWLEKMGVLSSELNNITALIGAAIIPIALYFQFVKKDGGSAKRLK